MKRKQLKMLVSLVIAVCMIFAISVQTFAAEPVRPFLASKTVSAIGIKAAAQNDAQTAVEDEQEEIVPAVDPVAEFKAEVLRLVNVERTKVGAGALTSLDVLSDMADVRARESAAVFSHTRPDGTRCFTVFSQYSLTYRAAGENLAYGFSTPERIVAAWMNSESHRTNMLGAKYTNIGVGYFLKSDGKVYCSLMMYTPRAM